MDHLTHPRLDDFRLHRKSLAQGSAQLVASCPYEFVDGKASPPNQANGYWMQYCALLNHNMEIFASSVLCTRSCRGDACIFHMNMEKHTACAAMHGPPEWLCVASNIQ